MSSEFDEIIQKQFAQIKRMAFLIFGGNILLFGLLIVVDLPAIDNIPNIWTALLISIVTIVVCGMVCSRLHKVQWIKAILVGKDAEAIDEKKLKRACGFYMYFFYGSFGSWFGMGVMGLMGTVFLGGKYWLAILGIPAIVMMVITWPKKENLINFIQVD